MLKLYTFLCITGKKVSVSVIAPEIGISSAYLSRIFKELLHNSVTDYINNYRLEQSCKLLANQALAISQVAIEAGFCDVKFYYKFFQKHIGSTPGEFRSKLVCIIPS